MDIADHGLESTWVDRMDMEKIWQNLSIEERELLYLWAVEGHSTREIAEILGHNRNTILSKIHRLRKRLHVDHPPQKRAEGGA